MAPSKKSQEQAGRDFVRRCQIDPLFWVSTVFGDNIRKAQINSGIDVKTKTGLTMQQEDALTQWGKLIEAKRNKMEGKPLTPAQVALSTKMGMSIQSSNGNGKTFLAALVTWHWNDVFFKPHILATANTGQQLRNVYWSDVSKVKGLAIRDAATGLSHLHSDFEMQGDKMFRKIDRAIGEQGKEWLTELVTINVKGTPDAQGESLSGRHSDYLLILGDEISGIPDAVFSPLDRTLTGPINLCFFIFNPTKNTGYAIDTQNKNKESWLTLHWNALECENISKDQIERLRKYGEDSPAYRIGVLGLPPVASENALIPYEWIQDAIDRDIVPTPYDAVILGCDVGGGGDRSTICIRQGGKIEPILSNNEKDTMKTVGWIGEHYHKNEASVCVVDSNGLGAGVADRLRELEFMVHPVEGQGKSGVIDDNHLNNRAAMYMCLREQFQNKAISIPDSVELVNELGAMKMEQSGNKTKIGSKKELRKVLGFSPDLADALAMTYAIPDAMYRRGGNHTKALPRRDYGIV